ncbi:viroplasmin family protein [Streptomyces sp. MBT65]|uniref:ribonuclease H1 domain-containing protein n=1 Tax=Streptomyces sp. MBT65 TaxID=1488395 RepID=UPI00190D00EC|nr:viroplasmin family protein [Streptomyces sp. MBT65]
MRNQGVRVGRSPGVWTSWERCSDRSSASSKECAPRRSPAQAIGSRGGTSRKR